MPLPLIAIVGRPNVGKSSLFNRLAGQPIAIVDPTPGVTRDRLIHRCFNEGRAFEIIDTGGIGIVDEAKLEADVYAQVQRAIATADRILFVVDGRSGILPLDLEIAGRLRPLGNRVVVVANKLDYDGLDQEVHGFLSFGLGDAVGVSAAAGRGIEDLLDRVLTGLDTTPPAPDPDNAPAAPIKICLAGRRNVGKSSLTNALCGENRVIVADLAGTTRDAIDVPLKRPEGDFILIDTAGLRKKAQIEADLEFYAACRTERAIQRCDIVLLVLDAADEVGSVDKKLAHYCEVEGKPTVIVVNKWDLAEASGATREKYVIWLRDRLPGLRFAPITFTCALTGSHLGEAMKLAVELYAETRARVTTAELNKLLEVAMTRRRPKRVQGHEVKAYYMTQAERVPPTFIVFVNRTDWIDPTWSRFLENWLREHLPFRRIPMVIKYKSRESRFREGNDKFRVIQAKTKAGRTASLVLPKSVRAQRKSRGKRP